MERETRSHRWKWPNQASLPGLAHECFENRFGHNTEADQATNQPKNCSTGMNQISCNLPNLPDMIAHLQGCSYRVMLSG
jgi:hypothetical protein